MLIDEILADKPCRTCPTLVKSHQRHCLPCGLRDKVNTVRGFGSVNGNPATEVDAIRYRRMLEDLHGIKL